MCVYIYIYIYIYRERERERETDNVQNTWSGKCQRQFEGNPLGHLPPHTHFDRYFATKYHFFSVSLLFNLFIRCNFCLPGTGFKSPFVVSFLMATIDSLQLSSITHSQNMGFRSVHFGSHQTEIEREISNLNIMLTCCPLFGKKNKNINKQIFFFCLVHRGGASC